MSLFIVEGVDRTGKTTLCERGVEAGGAYIHFGPPKEHPVEEYTRPLLDYVPGRRRDLWVDRHYLGERVWPKIFGRETEFDLPMQRFVELFLRSRGAVGVYAHRPLLELQKACEDEPVAGRVGDALHYFSVARRGSKIPWLPWQLGESTDHIEISGRCLEDEAAVPCAITWRWIGYPNPTTLLVGEQVNDPPTSSGLPFIPYKGRSGHFLLDELELLRPERFALCNALTPWGRSERLRLLWLALNRPKVVALGITAGRELERAGIKHGRVPHPQYWRRFKRREGPGSYAKLIANEL